MKLSAGLQPEQRFVQALEAAEYPDETIPISCNRTNALMRVVLEDIAPNIFATRQVVANLVLPGLSIANASQDAARGSYGEFED